MATTETAQPLSSPAAIPVSEAVEELWLDDYDSTDYPEDLYRATGEAQGIDGFEAIGDGEVAFFREHGYLVVNRAFAPAETQAALEGLLDLIDGKNPEFKGVQFEAKAREILSTLPREQKQDYVRKLNAYVDFDPRLQAIAEHPLLIDAITRLIGEAPALFANQAMLKPPLIGREKPWHQDHAFFNVPLGTRIIGCWLALDQATPENGCMHIIPRGHLEPVIHFKRRDWQICDDQVAVDRVLAVPLQPGGCLFFDGLLPHGTPATHSPKRRRALQLHYVPASVTRTSTEERMAIFGSEGKEVTC